MPLARLWENTSAKGVIYFSGYLGLAKVLILPNHDRQGDKDPTHVLLIAEQPKREGSR